MLFFRTQTQKELRLALRIAVAAHQPLKVSALLSLHGERAFALAMSDLSGRVIAMALSMLTPSERRRVQTRLDFEARDRLFDAEGRGLMDAPLARRPAVRGPLLSLLL